MPPVSQTRWTIIVPVHDALAALKVCIRSITANSNGASIIVVDDGSGAETQGFLREWQRNSSLARVLRNGITQGYTATANRGLMESTTEFLALLNSDTEVPPGWLERLEAGFRISPRVGLVGPLSNAAAWQSIPHVRDTHGDWAVNPLPRGLNCRGLDRLINTLSLQLYPSVRLLNGFCLCIRRDVLEKVGLFSNKLSPQGYGEEFDLCIRAAAEGFDRRVVDNTFVFHRKSTTFGHARRRELSAAASAALRKRYGDALIDEARWAMDNHPELEAIRRQFTCLFDPPHSWL